MYFLEKPQIWLNNFIRSLFFHFIFWGFAFSFFLFLTGYSKVFVNYFGLLLKDDAYGNVLFATVVTAIIFTIVDILFADILMRRLPIKALMLIRTLIHLLLGYLMLIFSVFKINSPEDLLNYKQFVALASDLNIAQWRFLTFFFVSSVINITLKGILRKIGLSRFKDWFVGNLNKPKEENRIFMFVDMKSSVTIAEKLGHKRFSYLVQDVFNDLSMVDNYGGEIYQYLGDGAIISWSLRKGLRKNNCLRAFYAFLKVINRRRLYYDKSYGMIPEFKAGLHIGKIMVLQVGSIRRDISFNGDTLNTTARIESQCNEYKTNLLISGVLYEKIDNKSDFTFSEVGNIKLKGKHKGIQIYKVNPKAKKKKKRK